MLFNSFDFLIFFPVVAILYWVLPHKIRWVWLLIASYYFYMSWNPVYILLMFLSTLLTYICGILVGRANHFSDETKKRRSKKAAVAICIIANLAILFYFKYYNFFADNIQSLFQAMNITLKIPDFDVLLPVGISFYTFQALGYSIDVYRGDIQPERNLAKYALFVSFFPQLVAGPIERSSNLLPQMHEKHTFSYTNMKNGLLMMLWGLFIKIVIADRAAIIVNNVYNNYAAFGGMEIGVATLLFAVQIYCDFAGYSTIAIGAAKVMGFRLMKNFDRPYFSKSIAEFWHRWHISLSTWFRDYVYIPLGGNRCSKARKNVNVLATFLVSGLWHGADWTFVVWGGLHGLYQIIGNAAKKTKNRIRQFFHVKKGSFPHKLVCVLATFILVDFAWIFFRANNITEAFNIIGRLFTTFHLQGIPNGALLELGLDTANLVVLFISIAVLFCVSLAQRKTTITTWIGKQRIGWRWGIYFAAIFAVLLFGIYGPLYDEAAFIYFQF